MQIKSKVEFEVEVTNEEVGKIAKHFMDKYTGNALIRAGGDKKEGWIVVYTIDENEFQRFLHDEFLPLIPVLEVVKENDVNTLSWPIKETEKVIAIINAKEAMPEI